MKIRNTIYKLGFLICLGLSISICACKKFVEIEPAPELIQTADLFNSEANAESAVLGVYLQLQSLNPSVINGSLSVYCGLSADELNTQSPNFEYSSFLTNSILPTSSIINSQFWTASYRTIYRANAILEGLNESSHISDITKQQFEGEMKTIRAFSYFNLANLFGDIPLITNTNYIINDQKARTPIDSIYRQIVSDLIDAISVLPESYVSNLRARINKHAAASLLARVYLYQTDWANAEKTSSNVISSGIFSLTTNLNQVFKNTSNETIWQLAPTNEARNTSEGGIFVPSSPTRIPNIFLSKTILNSFEENDLRKANWTNFNTVNGIEYTFPYKYKNRTTSLVDEYTIVLRLAEQYLIRAEARLQQENLQGAISDINVIRERAGLPILTTEDKSELIKALFKERQLELFAEYGHRWFDLKRTAKIDEILSVIKGSDWQTTDSLYPIPFNEIQFNSAMLQNPGY